MTNNYDELKKLAEVLSPEARRANPDSVHPSPQGRQVVKDALRAAASAPKAELTDERAAFEAAVRSMPGHPFAGKFLNLMWAAWQARAVLAQAAPAPLSAIDAAAAASAPKAELTDEHIRAAGGIVHKDGNIFFKNIDVLRAVLAQAAPVAVPEGWREFIENIATPYSEPLNSVSGYRDMASRKEMMGVLRAKARELLAAAPAAPVAAAVPAGWVKNTGVQPVGDNVLVAVVGRDGSTDIDYAGAYEWKREVRGILDILYYCVQPAMPDLGAAS